MSKDLAVRIYIILILQVVLFINANCQENRYYFAGDRFLEISESEFKKDNNRLEFFKFIYDLDSVKFHVKAPRRFNGKLRINTMRILKKELSKNAGHAVDSGQTIVINYHPGRDKCNKGLDGTFVSNIYKNYYRNIKRKDSVSQFFIYKEKQGTKKYGNSLKWFPDIDSLVEQTFFKIHYPCNSSVIIKPNGDYIAIRGEHHLGSIIDLLDDY